MTKPNIQQLGSVGLMLDGDPTMLPDAAFTDAVNIRFNGREITQYLGNQLCEYYTTDSSGVYQPQPLWLIDVVMFDFYSAGAKVLFGLGVDGDDVCVWQQSMITAEFAKLAVTSDDNYATGFSIDDIWISYKCQINNCQIFGVTGSAPIAKQYDWDGFDALTGWGEQTVVDSTGTPDIQDRRWTCKKIVSFDNRLLLLSTVEESQGGQDVPYPTRVRWSGFAQENSLPINWDDTAANRTPEDFASAVIDGYAGWQDLSSNYEVTDAAENGGTLYVYTERETYSLTPSGNDQSPFITKLVYSDLGCLDIGCCVNAHGYNYVFTGSDVVKHDSVSWVSVADGAVKEYLADYVSTHERGMIRLLNYPELSEIWVMMYGADQAEGDYAKTTSLTYNYVKKTWSRKTLPYINDACFCPIAPVSSPTVWDDDDTIWDDANVTWDSGDVKTAQGTMIGASAAGGVYYLNYGSTEVRNIISGGVGIMTQQDLQCYAERRGLEFNTGYRSMITEAYLNGKGANDITVELGRSDNPDSGYTWDTQTANLSGQRRTTWRVEGETHAYRLEIAGSGSIPVGVSFTIKSTGRAF
ncbi:hypothetical protein FDX19_15545 [Citrobacter sp. wls619]|uniref:hypothetical protein n=1 Tax=Citrobacter sp. wls619 TaxID=2576432 RepID=UPI0010C956F3|nr:hypothetical protein [Citrobacter sp. wls619]TKV08250.1 hypothetical protein FDX19_15545 [Citrobacter sp. wls619]